MKTGKRLAAWARLPWGRGPVGVVLAVLAASVALVAFSATRAQRESVVGYVDLDRVAEEYLRPVLDEPLRNETARLQAELDARVKGLDDEFEQKAKGLSESARQELREQYQRQKQELFGEYQRMLDARKQEMVNARLPRVRDAIGRVAQELGLDVVTDKAFVIWGGRDITREVLLKLGVKTQSGS